MWRRTPKKYFIWKLCSLAFYWYTVELLLCIMRGMSVKHMLIWCKFGAEYQRVKLICKSVSLIFFLFFLETCEKVRDEDYLCSGVFSTRRPRYTPCLRVWLLMIFKGKLPNAVSSCNQFEPYNLFFQSQASQISSVMFQVMHPDHVQTKSGEHTLIVFTC